MKEPESSSKQQGQEQHDRPSKRDPIWSESNMQHETENKQEADQAHDPEDEVDLFFRELGASLRDKFVKASLGEAITAAATIVVAISGIFALSIYGGQLAANKKAAAAAKSAAETAKNALVLENRPWIAVEGLPQFVAGSQSEFDLALRNYGKSPAVVATFPPFLISWWMKPEIRWASALEKGGGNNWCSVEPYPAQDPTKTKELFRFSIPVFQDAPPKPFMCGPRLGLALISRPASITQCSWDVFPTAGWMENGTPCSLCIALPMTLTI